MEQFELPVTLPVDSNIVRPIQGKKELSKVISGRLSEIDRWESHYAKLTDEELAQTTIKLREKLHTVPENKQEDCLEELLPEAFAAVSEAAKRTIGMTPYEVQQWGGIELAAGKIVEMRTGEGKTLTATLPIFLHALAGKGAHLITVNDYLARRDGGWMGRVYHALGMSVGCIGAERFSAVYDPEYVMPEGRLEDERLVHWKPVLRKDAYQADITYGTASEIGFDYLRDNTVYDPSDLVQRGLHFAVLDEVDNILLDDAMNPLIITTEPDESASNEFIRFSDIVRYLTENTEKDEYNPPNGDYNIDHKSRAIWLTQQGLEKVESRIEEIKKAKEKNPEASLYDLEFQYMTYYLDNALKAKYLFKRNIDYVVQNDQVIIIDPLTGRKMPGRRFRDGLHEALEAKEKVLVNKETATKASITMQNFFVKYTSFSGMTGTAVSAADEFDKTYHKKVVRVPTNVDYVVASGSSGLAEHREKVNGAEVVTYVDEQGVPRFFKRVDFRDLVFRTWEERDSAVVEEIQKVHAKGRPVLVGTSSIEHSERISQLLKKMGIPHNVLNAKELENEAVIVAQAGRMGAVTISTNMAGRGTDILLGGNPEGLAIQALRNKYPTAEEKLFVKLVRLIFSDKLDEARLLLDEEMGGAEEMIETVTNTLDQVKIDKEAVRKLGGLHLIGAERNESRRIDDQLRGRAARQGDPGSSQFFLSLDDAIFRRFGGARLEKFKRMAGVADGPIQSAMLDKIVLDMQKRAEGYNFDIRRYLKEFDDVLSVQRDIVYGDRRQILVGELSDNQVDRWIHITMEEVIGALISDYLVDYPALVQREFDNAVQINSTHDGEKVNKGAVLLIMARLVPQIKVENMEKYAHMSIEDLRAEIAAQALQNKNEGVHIEQFVKEIVRIIPYKKAPIVQAGSRYLPEAEVRDFVREHARDMYKSEFAQFLSEEQFVPIWMKFANSTFEAFLQHHEETDNKKWAQGINQQVSTALFQLRMDCYAVMKPEQVKTVLMSQVKNMQNDWREVMGDADYKRFGRQLLLIAIDGEWVDYLTSIDDLRGEIGLQAFGQKDPEIEFKKRAFLMFEDMQHEVDVAIGRSFFPGIGEFYKSQKDDTE